MSPPLYMSLLLVLLVLVCYGSALRVRSYRCTPHGRNDPTCSRMGDVFTCATNGGVVPYLSDGVVSTRYLWQGSSYLDLDIPNSVCLEAVVMTFARQASAINLPTFTIAQSTTVNTTYPPGTIAVGNTTITFTQQYCQPTIRINMTQANPERFTVLHEVFLIQPIDPSSPMTDPPTTMPPTEPASSSTASTPSNPTSAPTSPQPPPVDKQPSPGATSAPADLTIPLVAGMVVAGVVIIILLVVVMVIVSVLCILLKRLKASPPSDTKDSVIYDHVDQDPYSHVKMDKNPVYETTGTAVVLNNNPGPAYEKAGVEETNILA